MPNMNNIASLIREDITTLEAVYEEGGRHYTFKVPSRLALILTEGDRVLARSNGDKIKCVTVVEIHSVPDIDPDASYTYSWVFDRVDTTILEKLEQEDKRLVAALEAHKRQRVRESALQALGINDPQSLLFEIQSQVPSNGKDS